MSKLGIVMGEVVEISQPRLPTGTKTPILIMRAPRGLPSLGPVSAFRVPRCRIGLMPAQRAGAFFLDDLYS